jgi:hypothetical protein
MLAPTRSSMTEQPCLWPQIALTLLPDGCPHTVEMGA